MTRVYYREAVGALVVFDMTRMSTFQAVLKWKGDLDSKVNRQHGRPQLLEARSRLQGSSAFFFFFGEVALGNGRSVPAVLLANKCDQRDHGLCPKLPKLENFSRDYGFIGWYETSAKARPHCLLSHLSAAAYLLRR